MVGRKAKIDRRLIRSTCFRRQAQAKERTYAILSVRRSISSHSAAVTLRPFQVFRSSPALGLIARAAAFSAARVGFWIFPGFICVPSFVSRVCPSNESGLFGAALVPEVRAEMRFVAASLFILSTLLVPSCARRFALVLRYELGFSAACDMRRQRPLYLSAVNLTGRTGKIDRAKLLKTASLAMSM